jgi:hypothetical protein
MIYFTTTDGKAMLIVEQGNLDRLRIGKPMSTPDGKFIICYTPDLVRLWPEIEALVQGGDGFDVEKFDAILKESLSWPEKRR